MRSLVRASAMLSALLGLVLYPQAYAADPKIPAGRDPGGTAVVLLTRGFDYTRADVTRLLARDGEGELIGWDFVDNDARPFPPPQGGAAAAVDETDVVAALGALGGIKVIPVRVNPADGSSLARGVAFAARTPARVVVMPFAVDDSRVMEPFAAALRHFGDLLAVVAAPTRLSLPNVVAISNRDGAGADATVAMPTVDRAVVGAVALVIGCHRQTPDESDGRAAFLKALAAGVRADGAPTATGCQADGERGGAGQR